MTCMYIKYQSVEIHQFNWLLFAKSFSVKYRKRQIKTFTAFFFLFARLLNVPNIGCIENITLNMFCNIILHLSFKTTIMKFLYDFKNYSLSLLKVCASNPSLRFIFVHIHVCCIWYA